MGFFDKIKEIVTESDEDEYDDFYEDNKDGSVGIAPPIRDRFSRRESSSNERAERYSERPRIKGMTAIRLLIFTQLLSFRLFL